MARGANGAAASAACRAGGTRKSSLPDKAPFRGWPCATGAGGTPRTGVNRGNRVGTDVFDIPGNKRTAGRIDSGGLFMFERLPVEIQVYLFSLLFGAAAPLLIYWMIRPALRHFLAAV